MLDLAKVSCSPELNYSQQKITGVKNFSVCVLLTRPQKHALSEFQLFTGRTSTNHNVGSAWPVTSHYCYRRVRQTRTRSTLQILEECGWPQSHVLLVTQKHEGTEEFKALRLPLPQFHVNDLIWPGSGRPTIVWQISQLGSGDALSRFRNSETTPKQP